MKAALMSLTAGVFPGGRLRSRPDADVPRAEPSALTPRFSADGVLTFDKLAANYRSGNTTRDDIPSHLIVGQDVTPEAAGRAIAAGRTSRSDSHGGEAYRKNQRIMPKSTCSVFNAFCGIMEAPLGDSHGGALDFLCRRL
ncbi:MAG: hypothetical protein ACREML_10250 [Vulcanimicrobiaceae bacterium]